MFLQRFRPYLCKIRKLTFFLQDVGFLPLDCEVQQNCKFFYQLFKGLNCDGKAGEQGLASSETFNITGI